MGRPEAGNGPTLVVGLGNPGAEYAGSRHNVGFMVLDELAARLGVEGWPTPGGLAGLDLGPGRDALAGARKGHHGLYAQTRWKSRKLWLLWPQTYMNLSGRSVGSLARYFDIPPSGLVVVHDDLDLPVGRMKVAQKGGAGGHKGIASIITELGVNNFTRLKVGIGRPRHQEPIERFVLAPFYSDQREVLIQMVHAAADCLEVLLWEGAQAAMQKFHRPLSEEVKG